MSRLPKRASANGTIYQQGRVHMVVDQPQQGPAPERQNNYTAIADFVASIESSFPATSAALGTAARYLNISNLFTTHADGTQTVNPAAQNGDTPPVQAPPGANPVPAPGGRPAGGGGEGQGNGPAPGGNGPNEVAPAPQGQDAAGALRNVFRRMAGGQGGGGGQMQGIERNPDGGLTGNNETQSLRPAWDLNQVPIQVREGIMARVQRLGTADAAQREQIMRELQGIDALQQRPGLVAAVVQQAMTDPQNPLRQFVDGQVRQLGAGTAAERAQAAAVLHQLDLAQQSPNFSRGQVERAMTDPQHPLRQRVDRLMRTMDESNVWAERDGARRALTEMGPGLLPDIQRRFAEDAQRPENQRMSLDFKTHLTRLQTDLQDKPLKDFVNDMTRAGLESPSLRDADQRLRDAFRDIVRDLYAGYPRGVSDALHRMAEGRTPEQLQADLQTLARGLQASFASDPRMSHMMATSRGNELIIGNDPLSGQPGSMVRFDAAAGTARVMNTNQAEDENDFRGDRIRPRPFPRYPGPPSNPTEALQDLARDPIAPLIHGYRTREQAHLDELLNQRQHQNQNPNPGRPPGNLNPAPPGQPNGPNIQPPPAAGGGPAG
jgi:hypothetical protein